MPRGRFDQERSVGSAPPSGEGDGTVWQNDPTAQLTTILVLYAAIDDCG